MYEEQEQLNLIQNAVIECIFKLMKTYEPIGELADIACINALSSVLTTLQMKLIINRHIGDTIDRDDLATLIKHELYSSVDNFTEGAVDTYVENYVNKKESK